MHMITIRTCQSLVVLFFFCPHLPHAIEKWLSQGEESPSIHLPNFGDGVGGSCEVDKEVEEEVNKEGLLTGELLPPHSSPNFAPNWAFPKEAVGRAGVCPPGAPGTLRWD